MGRHAVVAVVIVGGLLLSTAGQAWGWGEVTHRKMVADATSGLGWLEGYGSLQVTPFKDMVRDVLGEARPVGSDGFKFKDRATREARRAAYLNATASIGDADLRSFAQNLLLSPRFALTYKLGETRRPVSAREVLAGYAAEPDWGMDRGLDASRDQGLMGGTDGEQTSSQGFRHMSFLLGKLGEAPRRAQLFFDLGQRAIAKGHAYWGFRFVSWGLHYLQDMGAPVHTNMLPTAKYVRLSGLLRPRGADGKRHFNRSFLGDLVKTSSGINANYHFLYEEMVERTYGKGGADAARLSAAVSSGKAGLLPAKSIEGVARRRGWSRLATPGIARDAIRYFGDSFRQPAPGGADNSVRQLGEDEAVPTVDQAAGRRPAESDRSLQARLAARQRILSRTTQQFSKNGVAIRRALEILHRDLRR